MSADTFDQGAAALSALPLTQAIVAGAKFASTVGQPVTTEAAMRAIIDAIASLEARVITLGG